MNTERVPEWLPTFLVPFFSLSYPSEPPDHPDSFTEANYYSTGLLDGWLIITCIAVMAILRDVLRIFVMEPFAHWYLTRKYASEPPKEIGNGSTEPLLNGNGHTTQTSQSEKNDAARKKKRDERLIRRSVLRFAEQGWSVIYYTIQWGFGVYVHCNLPTAPFNPTKLWLNYPHIPLSGPLKFYYTTQTAFYLHQILILNAEARRKDHYQMMTHHVITIALMVASYFYNFTRVGCLIMVLMDLCDIFLPLAKMFRYLSFVTLCDATFTCFLISWFVTRHVLFILVIKSAYSDAPKLIPFDWAPERGHYLTYEAYLAFITMLISLQFLQIAWFRTICRVAWRVVSGQGAEDTRSDSEGDEDEDEDEDEDSQPEDTTDAPMPKDSALKKRQ